MDIVLLNATANRQRTTNVSFIMKIFYYVNNTIYIYRKNCFFSSYKLLLYCYKEAIIIM